MLNSEVYPRFTELPKEKPAVKFTILTPGQEELIDCYRVLPLMVHHPVPTVGYQITSTDNKAVFYSGDTGPGLNGCWQKISPQLLIIEVTYINSLEKNAREMGHLTASSLEGELSDFRALKGYLPQIVVIHMRIDMEEEITREVAAVAHRLNASITIAHEGIQIDL
jgi:hypothetical protein